MLTPSQPSTEWRVPTASRKLPVSLLAALAQGLALVLSLTLAYAASHLSYPLPLGVLLLAHGVFAVAIAWRMGLPWWWLPIQFLFAPALVAALAIDLAPEWYLLIFAVLSLVYWSTYRTRVPLYLSGQSVWEAIESKLPARPGAHVLDLGSGLGGPLCHLAQRRPELQFEGIEAAPLPFAFSWLRSLWQKNLHFRFGSFWTRNLRDTDLVFAYLSPAAMPRLWDKVHQEMRPGSVFISVEFEVPGVEPDEIIVAGKRLLLWRF